jgi:maltose-binding protein MalE
MAVALMAVAFLCFSACGRNREGNPMGNENENGTVNNIHANDPSTLHSTPEIVNLTISVAMGTDIVARIAADMLAQQVTQQGLTLDVRYCTYFMADINNYVARQLRQLAEGEGPDILLLPPTVSLIPYMDNGFLADIYTLMDQSPTVNRGDFYTNVLSSLEVDGRLYTMPLFFSHNYIGINANVPQPFIDRFALLERASLSDIAAIYNDLIEAHPEFGDFALIEGIRAWQFLESELNPLIDIANRRVEFDDDALTIFYDKIRTALAKNRFETHISSFPTYEEMDLMQSRSVFIHTLAPLGLEAVIEYDHPHFVHYIPRADESGRLVIEQNIGSVVISKTAPPIALDFITHMIEASAKPDAFGPTFSLMIPIQRQFFPTYLEQNIMNNINNIERSVTDGFGQISQAISRVERYVEWPANISVPSCFLSRPLFTGAFDGIWASGVPAGEALYRLGQYFTHWLNPEFEIPPRIPDDRANLPVRTLTVLARAEDYRDEVLRQAADLLNDTWAREGREYVFALDLNSYEFRDSSQTYARLQTELMAGRGPDMFLYTWQPVREFARNGYLVDIYQLMDESPRSGRDDFFTQALRAYELDGGLYMFPLSFGYQYVSINANLPQFILDRFSQLSTVRASELFSLYHDLISDYGDEFGHLKITQSWNMIEMRNMLFSGFIDFDTRTSNLMDERFISILEAWAPLCPWDGSTFGTTQASWGEQLNSAEILEDVADYYMFIFEGQMLQPANAFLTTYQTSFVHHIPLTDEWDRLMLVNRSSPLTSNWANVCITAAGDSALAWEFTQHMILAHSQPTPEASRGAYWGNESLTSPIQRSLFRGHIERALETVTLPRRIDHLGNTRTHVPTLHPEELTRQINNAVARIATFNEMPMAVTNPHIPYALIGGTLDSVSWGGITAREGAQRLHNAITLWLME